MMIQQNTLGFPSFRDSGPQTTEQAMNFPRAPQSIMAMMSGFDVQFVDDDHHLHLLDIDLRTRNLSSTSVEVTGQFGLRDLSGDWDDRYAGFVRYTLIGTEPGDEVLGGTLNFPRANGSGPRTLNESVRFRNNVNTSVAALTGFTSRFSTSDHHLLQLEADVDGQSPGPNQMQVSGTYGLRDSSGNWDDDYDGILRYAALGTTNNDNQIPQIRTGRMEFSPQSGSGPRESATAITFANPFGNCAAVLTGFLIGFDQNDHHFHRAIVEVEARKLGDTQVEVIGRLGLRDDSGHWDDDYRGSIRFAVIAE